MYCTCHYDRVLRIYNLVTQYFDYTTCCTCHYYIYVHTNMTVCCVFTILLLNTLTIRHVCTYHHYTYKYDSVLCIYNLVTQYFDYTTCCTCHYYIYVHTNMTVCCVFTILLLNTLTIRHVCTCHYYTYKYPIVTYIYIL